MFKMYAGLLKYLYTQMQNSVLNIYISEHLTITTSALQYISYLYIVLIACNVFTNW